MKNANIAFPVRILLEFEPAKSASNALQGPCRVLFATSRIQNPMTKMAMARGLLGAPILSPVETPMSAAYPIRNTAMATNIAPPAINGRRRPKREVHRSL
ncbi:hypothetical protein HanXRQr2_Chr04g0157531 [Helianthus annuus]|uniref:Uncharacterized protein n=1 Tax=Helianthus annuus TaxID=4232 RepID=A0A9K3J7W5_HELAN|nr:hypothetical protein HanXRQr2_Chr04g0157531 [Helianthus annuus]KAJ0930638.1 hypothetical protein HanPSC8_Chr04g0151691 [Helianthus annuus]